MARRTPTGVLCARCVAAARWSRRRLRIWANWTVPIGARARRLALRITGRRERYELFEAATNGAAMAVRLDAIRLECSRRFGDVWLGWRVWCALELDRFCAAQMAEGASAWRGRRWR
jgi:hypothetical protein